MWEPSRKIDMKTALSDWRGKAWELEKWLRRKGLLRQSDKFNMMRGVSLWLKYEEPTAATFADADLFRLLNEKRLMREARRATEATEETANLLRTINETRLMREARRLEESTESTANYAPFFKLMQAAGNLSEFHNMVVEPDEMKYYIADAFKKALEKEGLRGETLVELEAELPSGATTKEVRRVNIENLDEIIRILENMGMETEEDLGYELGKITKYAEIKKATILDVKQLPTRLRPGKRRTPGFFSWLIKPSPFDLTRYQIYENIEDVDTEMCFLHALRMKGLDTATLTNISIDLKDIKTVTLATVEQMANKYNLHINVKAVYPKSFFNNRFPRCDMYNTSLGTYDRETNPSGWIELCFFTISGENYPEHIIPYDEAIKINFNYFKVTDEQQQYLDTLPREKLLHFSKYNRNGPRFDLIHERTVDSVELLRTLHMLRDKMLTPITLEQRKYLLMKDPNAEADLFSICPTCYRPWKLTPRKDESAHKKVTITDEIYNRIPNLHQVSGSVEAIIRKCISGLGPRISKTQHIEVPVSDLDIVSHYGNAASKIGLPLEVPKLWNKDVDLATVDAFFIMIDITKINRWRKYTAVRNLKTGIRWVDNIALSDLLKWHEIEYEIKGGIYFDGGSYSIASDINALFEQRKKAILEGDTETSKRIKMALNSDIYGKSIERAKPYDKKFFDSYEEAFTFLCRTPSATMLKETKNKRYAVRYGKRWTDSYNLAHFGCLILSMARAIINNVIFTLEDAGVEVLYSNVDSLFIRTSDMSKFNELFPNAIGNEMGQFHSDLDFKEFTEAQEAIFLKKGLYILKLGDDKYQCRNVGNYFTDPTWDCYMNELNVLNDKVLKSEH